MVVVENGGRLEEREDRLQVLKWRRYIDRAVRVRPSVVGVREKEWSGRERERGV